MSSYLTINHPNTQGKKGKGDKDEDDDDIDGDGAEHEGDEKAKGGSQKKMLTRRGRRRLDEHEKSKREADVLQVCGSCCLAW